MNKIPTKLQINRNTVKVFAIVVGIAACISTSIVVAQDFEGSEFCQQCHEANYSEWKASGHPYKLMKSEEARNRPIPLPIGIDWDDVSYVIGGYKWKSRYVDTDGYIITTTFDEDGDPVPGVNQYNYLTGQWSDYHAGEENKPYDCGACHTTGWVADEDADIDNDLSDNQDGMPGMHGTFAFGGIHCEECHGPGFGSMEIDDSAEFCGSCHFRDSPPGSEVNSIPASGGFIKHHEQYNEHLAGPHANFKCVTCHNPHKRAEFSIVKECSVCHGSIAASYETHAMADYGVECKDCHMPFATKSAQALGPHQGDLQTHIFYINTDPEANMFTEDGAFVALEDNGKAAVTLDFACQRCHQTADLNELAKFAKNFHDQNLDEIGLNAGLTGTWWNAGRAGEGFVLEFGLSNGTLTLFAAFYTYDNMGNQAWLTAQPADPGLATSGTTANVDVSITDGPMWGDDYDSADVNLTQWGTGTFTFTSCGAASVTLTPNQAMIDLGYTAQTHTLTRDLLESGIQCPTFVNNAN
ncbi:MAG: hypothetical protein V3S21_04535 [Xanthomonadales bacterium]